MLPLYVQPGDPAVVAAASAQTAAPSVRGGTAAGSAACARRCLRRWQWSWLLRPLCFLRHAADVQKDGIRAHGVVGQAVAARCGVPRLRTVAVAAFLALCIVCFGALYFLPDLHDTQQYGRRDGAAAALRRFAWRSRGAVDDSDGAVGRNNGPGAASPPLTGPVNDLGALGESPAAGAGSQGGAGDGAETRPASDTVAGQRVDRGADVAPDAGADTDTTSRATQMDTVAARNADDALRPASGRTGGSSGPDANQRAADSGQPSGVTDTHFDELARTRQAHVREVRFAVSARTHGPR